MNIGISAIAQVESTEKELSLHSLLNVEIYILSGTGSVRLRLKVESCSDEASLVFMSIFVFYFLLHIILTGVHHNFLINTRIFFNFVI